MIPECFITSGLRDKWQNMSFEISRNSNSLTSEFFSNYFFLIFSGTNDKAGGPHYMLKWASPQSVKQTFVPLKDVTYPYMTKN